MNTSSTRLARKNKFFWLGLCMLLFPVCLLASPLGCPSYYPGTQHKLIAVNVFNKDKNGVYDLAPEESPRKGHIVNQHWDGMSGIPKLPAFFTCSYLNTPQKITQEIPVTIKTCRFIFYFPDQKNIKFINQFFCH